MKVTYNHGVNIIGQPTIVTHEIPESELDVINIDEKKTPKPRSRKIKKPNQQDK